MQLKIKYQISVAQSKKKKKEKQTGYNTKITKIEEKLIDHNHGKYITAPEFNKFTEEV